MSIKLENLNIDLIDLNGTTTPELFINKTGISFSRKAIELLNFPAYVQYGIDPQNLIFSIKACKQSDKKAATFVKNRSNIANTLFVTNKNLYSILINTIPDINTDIRYKINGEFISSHRQILFDLSYPVICELRHKNL